MILIYLSDAFTLRIKETFRQPFEKHTSVYAFQRRDLCIAQISLLLGTTAIHGGSASPTLLQIDDADARSVQKTPAGVLFVHRGLFFVKRQRRCAVYLQKDIFKRQSR